MIDKSQWCDGLQFQGNHEIIDFLKEYYQGHQRNVLFILGKGFDPRMNNVLSIVIHNIDSKSLSCISVDFPAGHPTNGDALYEENVCKFKELINEKNIVHHEIFIDTHVDQKLQIKKLCNDILNSNIQQYSDIIVDVSAFPRAIYFNLIKFLYERVTSSTNLFVSVSENVEIDRMIRKEKSDLATETAPLFGFDGGMNIFSDLSKEKILIPVLGEGQEKALLSIYQSFKPSDVCPILPFPSKNPRRSDDLLMEYRCFLEDRVHIKPQDIMYADESNPFELYRRLTAMMTSYQETLSFICEKMCFGIAVFTSKLQSLGVVMVGIENKNVAIYNVSTTDYIIDDFKQIQIKNDSSENYLIWLKGEPYD